MTRSRRAGRQHQHPAPPTAAVRASALCYAANCALGAAVAARLIDTRRIRWLHHALYIATTTTTALALVAELRHDRRVAAALSPALIPLAVIPFAGTRTRRHPAIALCAAPFFAAAVLTSR